MSDEIGHFENCLQLDANFNCTVPGNQDAGGLDEDDGNNFCVPGSDSTLVNINGCFSADADWDGQSYSNDWPGTNPNVFVDRVLHPTPVLFTSPLAEGRINYSTIAFETDLPRIEASDSQDNPPFCDRSTGADCVNPPNGRAVLPVLHDPAAGRSMQLAGGWQLHPGNHAPLWRKLPSKEFGSLLQTVYPVAGFTTALFYNNFNSGDTPNPCRTG